MRLHALEVTAFGPFGDTVSVDFDALGADGLFLLHGQTGAGKTTVLDAVAFALYGRVPGARQDGKRLLSDHAEVGAVPKVVLEATIGGRRLRITRSPEFQRAKLRGAGTTKENAKASLEWLDGHGQNLTRLDEIGETVGRLLGMSADQFFQVVLLPQGDFARFLRADTEERGKLLERLFDTARFGTVEEWFADRKRESESAIAGRRSAVDRIAAQVSAAAGIEAGADADPVEWAGRLAADVREVSDAAVLELASAQVSATKIEAALQRTREVHASQERAATARARLAEMAAGRDVRDGLAAELDRAVRAAAVAAAQLDVERAGGAAATALAAVDEFAAAVAREPEGAVLLAQVSWPERATDPETLAAGAREWVAEVARLGDLIEQETQLRSARAELDRNRERRTELSTTATQVESLREAVPGKLADCDADLVRVRSVGATVPMLAEQLTLARGRLTAATDLDRVREERTAAGERHTLARHAHLDARDALSDLRELRIAGMAAELAVDLVDGDGCPVCGATAHPALAQHSESAVTKADEDAARAQERRRGQEFESVTAELAELDRTVEVLADRAGEAGSAELAAALVDAQAAHTEAVRTAATETAALTALDELRTERDRLASRSEETARDLAALDQRITDDTRRLAELEARISRAVGGESDLRARRDRLDALAGATSELRDRRAVASRAVLDATAAAAKVTAAALGAGFDDVAQALAAVCTQSRIVEIEGVLAAAREDTVRAEAVLADPAVLAAVALEPADVGAAESAHEAAGQVRTTAIAAASGAEDRAANVAHYAQALNTEVGELAPLLRRHEELAALADVIAGRGQNARKMSLRSYVLAARLEEVALSASVRLRKMSGGRYEFVHEDGVGPRGKRGGLGLDIRDDYTGVVRSAKTLSGGESFLASLALALGLADVVAAESGGVVLDTMFIDEGFGTLDAETLESVMGVLDELRAGGRVVGIVSHVDEMRQRIPSRLHVIRGRTGSSVEVVAG